MNLVDKNKRNIFYIQECIMSEKNNENFDVVSFVSYIN